MRPNPIYGFKIVSIKATGDGTTIYRLDHALHKEFLGAGQARKWFEKEIESKFPDTVNFSSASRKIKQHLFNSISMKIYKPGEILLKAGSMPDEIKFLAQGRIQVLQKLKEDEDEHPNAFKLKT